MQIINEKPEAGLESYVPEFIENRYKDICLLEDAIAKGDFLAIAKMAHTWKGFSRPFGFVQLEVYAIELESEATLGNLEPCQEILVKTKAYLDLKKKP